VPEERDNENYNKRKEESVPLMLSPYVEHQRGTCPKREMMRTTTRGRKRASL
jgi:hypothetical protein